MGPLKFIKKDSLFLQTFPATQHVLHQFSLKFMRENIFESNKTDHFLVVWIFFHHKLKPNQLVTLNAT